MQEPGPSNVLSALHIGHTDEEEKYADQNTTSDPKLIRDSSDMTIVERLKMGPYQHTALDDPKFESIEPHSSIKLL
jgi:hypothetical protein